MDAGNDDDDPAVELKKRKKRRKRRKREKKVDPVVLIVAQLVYTDGEALRRKRERDFIAERQAAARENAKVWLASPVGKEKIKDAVWRKRTGADKVDSIRRRRSPRRAQEDARRPQRT